MVSERKIKGDLAVSKVVADLTEKGYVIFTPLICEHLPFDLIAYKEGKSFRLQCKSSNNGFVCNKTVWSDKHGNHVKKYLPEDFDYYAVYISSKNIICYPSITFGGITINVEKPNCYSEFYWYEDFLSFTDVADKRKNLNAKHEITDAVITAWKAKEIINWPSSDELQKLLWEKSTTQLAKELGVSDKAITKRAKKLGLSKPGVGYWTKIKNNLSTTGSV